MRFCTPASCVSDGFPNVHQAVDESLHLKLPVYRFNDSRFDGLSHAAQLKRLFPNLVEQSGGEMCTLDLSALTASELSIDTLAIDLPGISIEQAKALVAVCPSAIQRLFLLFEGDAYYQQFLNLDAWDDLLVEAAWVRASISHDDGSLTRFAVFQRNERLHSRFEALTSTIDQKNDELDALRQRVEQLSVALKHSEARNSTSRQYSELEVASQVEALSSVNAEMEQARHDLSACEQHRETLQAQLDEVRFTLEQTAAREQEANQALRIAQKQTVKLQDDIEALRGQYQHRVAELAELTELISMLRQKLQRAAALYERLMVEAPETVARLELEG